VWKVSVYGGTFSSQKNAEALLKLSLWHRYPANVEGGSSEISMNHKVES